MTRDLRAWYDGADLALQLRERHAHVHPEHVEMLMLRCRALRDSRADAAVMVDCPFNDGGGDNLDRGFYISAYAGTTLKSVRIAHHTTGAVGVRTIQMTARLNNYGGVLVGTASVTREIESAWTIS